MLDPDLLNDIDIRQDEGGWWVATDEYTGVSSQGKTRFEALENLNEAVDGYKGEGREPTPEELREIGIDPDKNVSGKPLPDEFQ
ncbi:type II toxin-antitoxin system HicB family antitoxin [Natronorubrum sp. FCH18a]|uniref:type II toxin-antitoxin system HicB family antitoxin n=1 Tax=Natronorubrum sp. FCH18a TaxID=3447018 RepID=UPI003F5128D8